MIVPLAERLQVVEEYYFAAKLRRVRELESAGKRVINLGIGSPDLPPSPATIDRLVASASDGRNYKYQPYKGIPQLREAMAGYLSGQFGCTLNPATEILPLPGSKQGMLYVTLAFVNPGEAVLVPDPGYPTYSGVAQLTGARVIPYPLDPLKGWAPDWDALERMDLRGVKLMWTNYPHMPTGAPGSREILDSIVRFGLKRRMLVCHDNPYAQLVSAGQLCSILQRPEAGEVAVELHSMSKSHNLSGWRIGWAAGGAGYIDAIGRVASNVESGMSLALQQAATVALHSDPAWYAQLRTEYNSRRALGSRILETLGCTVAGGQAGMFVWGHVTAEGSDVEQFADDILERMHVFIVPGSVFGKGGGGYLRLALCSPLPVLEEAAARATQGMQNPAWRSA